MGFGPPARLTLSVFGVGVTSPLTFAHCPLGTVRPLLHSAAIVVTGMGTATLAFTLTVILCGLAVFTVLILGFLCTLATRTSRTSNTRCTGIARCTRITLTAGSCAATTAVTTTTG